MPLSPRRKIILAIQYMDVNIGKGYDAIDADDEFEQAKIRSILKTAQRGYLETLPQCEPYDYVVVKLREEYNYHMQGKLFYLFDTLAAKRDKVEKILPFDLTNK